MRYPVLISLGVVVAFTLSAHADVCPHKVDPKKTMIFIDLNGNIEEVHSAQRAACARGEKIDIIPSDFENRNKMQIEIARLDKKKDQICGTWVTNSSDACRGALKTVNDAIARAGEKQVNVQATLTAELEKLKSVGGILPSFRALDFGAVIQPFPFKL